MEDIEEINTIDTKIKLVATIGRDDASVIVRRLNSGKYRIDTTKCSYIFTKDGASAFLVNILLLTDKFSKIELITESGFVAHGITFSGHASDYTAKLIARTFETMAGFVSIHIHDNRDNPNKYIKKE